MNRQKLFVVFIAVALLLGGWSAIQYVSDQRSASEAIAGIDSREEKVMETLLSSKVETITIQSETLSDLWKSSGALDKGYSLDEYTEAVRRLNPEREDVTTLVSGMTELKVITKVTLARPE